MKRALKYKNILTTKIVAWLTCSIVLLYLLPSYANAQQISEYQLKAVYITSFEKFVTWPPPTSDKDVTKFVIGIYAADPFDFILEQTVAVLNSKSQNKTVLIEHCYNDINKVDNCDILFISGVNQIELINLLDFTRGKPFLTVGDNLPNFCELGGIINFTPQKHPKQFFINNEAATESGLIISSKLLILAQIVNYPKK